MKNRKAVRINREDEKSHGYEWEVIDPLDNPETVILAEEDRQELAQILGPGITKYIERVLKRLPPNKGFIVLARDLLRMSHADLATLLYKSESNVRKTYSQAKRHLKGKVH